LNNNLNNLRWATLTENQYNRKINKNNTSGIKGVSWDKKSNKWRASIKINRKKIFLGNFETFDEAKLARQITANNIFGEFVNQCEK
jgi:hypothetical protein